MWIAGRYFHGLIDEVRIYNRALTAMEVQKHYAQGAEKRKLTMTFDDDF